MRRLSTGSVADTFSAAGAPVTSAWPSFWTEIFSLVKISSSCVTVPSVVSNIFCGTLSDSSSAMTRSGAGCVWMSVAPAAEDQRRVDAAGREVVLHDVLAIETATAIDDVVEIAAAVVDVVEVQRRHEPA